MEQPISVEVNLDEVNEFIESDRFVDFLINNTNFSVAGFVLDTLVKKVNSLKMNQE